MAFLEECNGKKPVGILLMSMAKDHSWLGRKVIDLWAFS
jgi:hypothetical protein